MRALAVVFRREIQERRLLFLAALLLGLVPLILPLLPGVDPGHPSDVRQATAAGLMMIAALALAVLLGATGIAGDLMAGRMSFYFSRPVPAWSIWAGKLAAMLALVFAVAGLIALPTLLVEGFAAPGLLRLGGKGVELASAPSVLVPGSLGVALLLLASHFAAVSIRSRSPWLVLDLAGLLVTAGVAASIWRACLREGMQLASSSLRSSALLTSLLGQLFGGFGLALLLALLIASALQVARGRIDPRRGHRVQSLVFWSLAALALAGLGGVYRWAVAVTPADLVTLNLAQAAPSGPWLALLGPVRHRPGLESLLLFNAESGEFARTRAALSVSPGPEIQFSEDGRRAYWFEPQDLRGSPLELMTLDLGRPGARPRATGAVFAPGESGSRLDFLVSPDGRRLAVFLDRRLTVEDLPSHKLLLAQAVEEVGPYFSRILRFAGPDRLRLDVLNQYRGSAPNLLRQGFRWEVEALSENTRVTLYEADLTTGKLVRTGSVESSLSVAWWERSPDGERGVLLGPNRTEVRDGRSGALLASFPGRTFQVCFVPGGLVALQRTEEGREALLFDREGRQVRARLALPGKGLMTVQAGLAGADPVQLFARRLRGGSGNVRGAVWNRWRIALDKGAFEPLPSRTLSLLGAGVPWNPQALRRTDGAVTFSVFDERMQVHLRPGR